MCNKYVMVLNITFNIDCPDGMAFWLIKGSLIYTDSSKFYIIESGSRKEEWANFVSTFLLGSQHISLPVKPHFSGFFIFIR